MAIMWDAPEHPATSVTPVEVAWKIYLAQGFAKGATDAARGRVLEHHVGDKMQNSSNSSR